MTSECFRRQQETAGEFQGQSSKTVDVLGVVLPQLLKSSELFVSMFLEFSLLFLEHVVRFHQNVVNFSQL